MMRVKRVKLSDVLSDDENNEFWKHIKANPDYPKFLEDLKHVMKQSRKHGKPYKDVEDGHQTQK